MTAAICLKYFGQTISLVPERSTTVSVNWFEHCQGLSLKVLISFFRDTFNENSHASLYLQIRSVRYNKLSFGKFSCSNIARIWPPAMMDHFVTWDYTLPPPPTLAKVKAIFFRLRKYYCLIKVLFSSAKSLWGAAQISEVEGSVLLMAFKWDSWVAHSASGKRRNTSQTQSFKQQLKFKLLGTKYIFFRRHKNNLFFYLFSETKFVDF